MFPYIVMISLKGIQSIALLYEGKLNGRLKRKVKEKENNQTLHSTNAFIMRSMLRGHFVSFRRMTGFNKFSAFVTAALNGAMSMNSVWETLLLECPKFFVVIISALKDTNNIN